MSSGSLDLMRSANDQLRKFREGLAPTPAEGRDRLPTAADLQGLGRLMEQVRPLLKENPDDPALRAEIGAYTENLRQVRGLLEGLQSELNARRDDLRKEWKRLQAAAAWGGTLKQMR